MQSCKSQIPQMQTKVAQTNSLSSVDSQSLKPQAFMWDKIGIWVSSLCALHCMALPLLLPVLPVIATTFFAEAWFEHVILALSMMIGFAALFVGFHQYHRQLYPIYSLATGGIVYWQKDIFGHEYEPLIIGIGAGLIIIAHFLNVRLCKRCKGC